MAIAAGDRKDDVKLGQALLRLNEEDPSLTMIQNPRTHDIVLWGQGEMHLRVALERLHDRFGVNVKSQPPAIGYQETIRKSISQRGRQARRSCIELAPRQLAPASNHRDAVRQDVGDRLPQCGPVLVHRPHLSTTLRL